MSFISNLQKKRCDYNHPDQATSQANSLILLSSGIYTEEERFVFELLQNAVDAHSDDSKLLDVKMIIKDGYFIFLHNGDAFTERDIEGLCDVGNGNKMKDVKKIGYKGIGFKSVFMRSDCVTVESGGYCFKFDKSYWDNYWDEHWSEELYGTRDADKIYLMPWQIIPIATTPPVKTDREGYNVATYIKINGIDSLEHKIIKLLSSSQFLLFLMCKKIRMTFICEGETKCCIEKKESKGQVVLSTNGRKESKWLIYTNKNVEVPPGLKQAISADINTPDKLKNVDSFDLSFAIALDDKGKLKRLEHAVVYTYLPTSFCFGSEGFPFLVNANFITDAGRQQLHKDSEWNKLIFSKIPFEYLTWMSMISTNYHNYWEVLPEKTYGNGNPLEEIYAREMEKAIKEIAFIPCLTDTSRKVLASDAFMDRLGISEAISVKALVGHINKTYFHSFIEDNQIANIWKGSRILSNYGVFIFDKQKIKSLFDDNRIFDNITAELDAKLIVFIHDYYKQNKPEQAELDTILHATKFILDDTGSLCLPSELFFPSSYKEQNELAEDAKILNEEIHEAIASNDELIAWLASLGIEELSDVTFIRNVICEYGYVTEENAIDVVRFLYETNNRVNIFVEIGEHYLQKLYFLTKKGDLQYASKIYLGSCYNPIIDLEKVYDADIYISEKYADIDPDNIGQFLKKLGVVDNILLSNVQFVRDSEVYNLLRDYVNYATENEYNHSSYTHKDYNMVFSYINVKYPPLIGVSDTPFALSKLIWTQILKKPISLKREDDFIFGPTGGGYYKHAYLKDQTEGHMYLGENFLPWVLKCHQTLPGSDGSLHPAHTLFRGTNGIRELFGHYIPFIDVEEIDESWDDILPLKENPVLDDYLSLLERISEDPENVADNEKRVSQIYEKILLFDVLEDSERAETIKDWAKEHTILSEEKTFVSPSELSYITLDGFSSKNRVYIGSPSNKEKIVELMALMGVKIITSESIKAEFDGKTASDELRTVLKGKLSPLALLRSGENANETEYTENKSTLSDLISNTQFFHCEKIKLTYGNSDDVIEKHTFGNGNEFYYIGNLRPANIEPLLEPLCKYLGMKGKERELFIMLYDDIDGIKQNLKDKGYNVSLIEDEVVQSGTFNATLNYSPLDTDQVERNIITGFKGEIIVYEKLISMGYRPVCPSISTKDDYEREVVVNGKAYYCKSNYNSDCDISFETENGHRMLIEVKATTTLVGHIENMPISAKEWSMIKRCDKEQRKSYIIARVFGIDSPKQDIYLFKSHIFE